MTELDVLTAVETARLLRIGLRQLYEAAGRQEIPHRRVGKRLLFSRQAVLEWLACKPSSREQE